MVGTFAHSVLEELCGLEPAERNKDRAKLLARELWPDLEEDSDFQALELSDEDSRAFRWRSWLAIAGLWDLEDPAKIDVVATEQKVEATLDGVPFLGIIDRLEREGGKLIVSDYKSGKVPSVRWRDDKIQQIMLYAAAVSDTEDEQPDRARLLYLGQETLDFAVTDRRIEDASGQLATTWSSVLSDCSSDEFEASPGVLCGWCPFAVDCPEGMAELTRRSEAGNLPSHAPAAALVS